MFVAAGANKLNTSKHVKSNLLQRTDKLQSTGKARSGKPAVADVPISILQVERGSLVVIIVEELCDIFWVCVSNEHKSASGGKAICDPRWLNSPSSLPLTR